MECLNDNQILAGIRNCDEKIVAKVYAECFSSIRHLVLYNQGTLDEARDLFQDAMVIICERLQKDDLELTCSFSTFLYAISRNLWFRRLHERKKTVCLDREISDRSLIPSGCENANVSLMEERLLMFQRHFNSLTSSCKKIIKLILKKSTTNQIMKAMNFSSVAYTRKRKYQCKHSLIKRIKADSDYHRLKDNENTSGENFSG